MRSAFVGSLILASIALSNVAGAASPRRPSDAERGRELYDRLCLSCHGAAARGDGPAAADLVVPVPNLADKLPESGIEVAITVVLKGRGAMPSYEATFDSYDARRVLRHMSSLASKPAPAPPSRVAPSPGAAPTVPVAAPPPPPALPAQERP